MGILYDKNGIPIRPGDRVIYQGSLYGELYDLFIDNMGTVLDYGGVELDFQHCVPVEFDEERHGLHGCDGLGQRGRCWFCSACRLEVVEDDTRALISEEKLKDFLKDTIISDEDDGEFEGDLDGNLDESSVCDDCSPDGWECQFCCLKCMEDFGECPDPDGCDPWDI